MRTSSWFSRQGKDREGGKPVTDQIGAPESARERGVGDARSRTVLGTSSDSEEDEPQGIFTEKIVPGPVEGVWKPEPKDGWTLGKGKKSEGGWTLGKGKGKRSPSKGFPPNLGKGKKKGPAGKAPEIRDEGPEWRPQFGGPEWRPRDVGLTQDVPKVLGDGPWTANRLWASRGVDLGESRVMEWVAAGLLGDWALAPRGEDPRWCCTLEWENSHCPGGRRIIGGQLDLGRRRLGGSPQLLGVQVSWYGGARLGLVKRGKENHLGWLLDGIGLEETKGREISRLRWVAVDPRKPIFVWHRQIAKAPTEGEGEGDPPRPGPLEGEERGVVPLPGGEDTSAARLSAAARSFVPSSSGADAASSSQAGFSAEATELVPDDGTLTATAEEREIVPSPGAPTEGLSKLDPLGGSGGLPD